MPSPTKPTPEDFAYLERMSRRALRYHELKARQRLICDIIIDYSFALGRLNAYIRTQYHFSLITDISKGNISTIIASLERARVIQTNSSLGLYAINIDFESWSIPSQFRGDEWVRAAHRVEDWLTKAARLDEEQLHLLPPLPNLDALLAEESREELLRQAASQGGGGDFSPNTPAVSHRVTAFHDGGERSATALQAAIAASMNQYSLTAAVSNSEPENVPKMGTSKVPGLETSHLMHLDESYSSHLDESSKCVVPSLGTERRKPVLERELLGEISRLCGKTAMEKYGGYWRIQIRRDPVAVREAIAELKLRLGNPRGDGIKKTPGHYLRNKYREISGNELPKT